MNLNLSGMHMSNARSWMTARVTIERPLPDGGWAVSSTNVPCDVQQPISQNSDHDPDRATGDEKEQVVMYVMPTVLVKPGYRVLWKGEYWHVEGVTGPRSQPYATRVTCTLEQSSVREIEMSFRRRREDKTWLDLGPFMVRMTFDPFVPQETSGTDHLAVSARRSGTMTGGSDLLAVNVGDWFGHNNMPGRVTSVDRTDHEWVELGFTVDVEVP